MKKTITKMLLVVANIGLAFTLSAQIPSNGLVAYFPFTIGAADSSGNGIMAKSSLATFGQKDRNGEVGKAASFTYNQGKGTPLVFSFSQYPALKIKGDATISLWMKYGEAEATYPTLFEFGGKFFFRTYGSFELGYSYGAAYTLLPVRLMPAKEWTHFAIVKKTGDLFLYKNGVLFASAKAVSTPDVNYTGVDSVLSIGQGLSTATKAYDGLIDELTIHNRALTDVEIKQVYRYKTQFVPINVQPVATQACEFSDATLSVTATGATSYQWYFNSKMISEGAKYQGVNTAELKVKYLTKDDTGSYHCEVSSGLAPAATNVVKLGLHPMPFPFFEKTQGQLACKPVADSYQWLKNGVPIAGATNQSLTLSGNGSYQVIQTSKGCTNTSFTFYENTDHLIAYLPFTNNVVDSSANPVVPYASVGNFAKDRNGALAKAIAFSATGINGVRYNLKQYPQLKVGENFTTAFWVYDSTGAGYSTYLEITKQFFIRSNNSNIEVGAFNGTSYNLLTKLRPKAGVWYHLAVSKSATSITVYVNGNKVGNLASTRSVAYLPSDSLMVIGNAPDNLSSKKFMGRMDEFYLFGNVLTEAEVFALYQRKTPIPSVASSDKTMKACEGGPVVLQVASTGAVNYQWFKDAAPLSASDEKFIGATTNTLRFDGAATASGKFYCQLYTANKLSYQSDTSTVDYYVSPRPVLKLTGSTLSTTATFNTIAWYKDGQPISAATANSYTPIDSGSFQALVTNTSGCRNFSNAVLVGKRNPTLAYYPFNNSYLDSGSYHIDPYSYKSTFSPDRNGQAFAATSFSPGSNDRILVSLSKYPQLKSHNFTIATWVKWSTLNAYTYPTIVEISDKVFLRFFLSNKVVEAGVHNGTEWKLISSNVLADDYLKDWHHIAVTKSNTALTMYVDGVQKSTISAPAGAQFFLSDTIMAIGSGAKSSSTKNFNGTLDQLLITGNALTATEIVQLKEKGPNVLSGLAHENTSASSFFHPNPATQMVYISPAASEVQLLDATGQVIWISHERSLNVSQLPRGMYILKLVVGQKLYSSPVLIK